MRDLVLAVEENMKQLKGAINARYKISIKRAKAEYEYRSALGTAMAEAKADGMAATALYEYCRGIERIAKLRDIRDVYVAQEEYLTQMIYYYKTEVRIAENQIDAERKGV